MSYDGPWIDAHVHQWDPRTSPRTVSTAVKALGWRPQLLRWVAERAFPADKLAFVGDPDLPLNPYLPGDWYRDTGDRTVRGFVHVQADWKARHPLDVVEETRWLEHLCGSDLLAIVGKADLASPSLDRVLDGHLASSTRVRGIRDYLTHGGTNPSLASFADGPDRTREAAWRRGYDRLGERGFSFDIWAYGQQLDRVATLVAAHPGTPAVLDHLGSPVGFAGPHAGVGITARERAQILGRWREDVVRIAEAPHVHVKLSGLAMTISGFGWHRQHETPSAAEVAEGYRPLVAHALQVFGPDRCMVASNFPMDSVSVAWSTLYDAFEELTGDLTETQRRAVFHDNAARFYRIEG